MIFTALAKVFPARAGMIPPTRPGVSRQSGIPRESGDDPCPGFFVAAHVAYSPRERG